MADKAVTLPNVCYGFKTEKPLTNYDFENDDLWPRIENLKEEMRTIQDRGMYTDDLPTLTEMSHHYVFVYGTLRMGFRNHKWLADQDFVGCGYTDADRFFMCKHKTHKYPVAFFDGRQETRGRLYGEVYKVESAAIRDLDYLESHELMYKRYPVKIDVYNKKGELSQLRCFTYLGIKPYWKERENFLLPARKAKPNNGDPDYYIFTPEDEK